MTVEVDVFQAVMADLLGSEWKVLMLMCWQMNHEGFVYGVPAEVTERTYYRVRERLHVKGLVLKVGKYWQVNPAFAKRLKPPPDRKPREDRPAPKGTLRDEV